MNIETLRDYCLRKPGTSEGTPFDEDTLVFKVMGKIFAITGIESFDFINLKCDPEYAVHLREEYPGAIRPGYHMNKKLWNSVSVLGEVPDRLIFHLIDHSYDLIVAKLPASERKQMES